MDIRQLIFFHTAASAGSFAKASEQLFVSRQAVSKAVHQLEFELGGVPLFLQEGKTLVLTPAGAAFCERILPVIGSFRELEAFTENFRQNIHAVLHIAVGPSVFWLIPPEVILAFADRYPGLRIILDETTDVDLKNGLASGRFEGAIAGLSSSSHDAFSVIEFSRDPLYSVMSEEHPLAVLPVIDPYALSEYPCIFPRNDSTLYSVLMEALHKRGILPQVALIARDLLTVVHSLKDSRMLAVNYLPTIQAFQENGLLVRPLDLGDFRCSTSLFFKKEIPCREILYELGEYLKNYTDKKEREIKFPAP